MTIRLQSYINFVWFAVGAYWAIGALRAKPTVRQEHSLMRLVHIAVLVGVYFLLYSAKTHVGVLGIRFVPEDQWIGWMGFGLVVAGAAIAVWARTILGANWSGMVTVKRDHELVRRGPYAIVRHPIYTGLLLSVFGTALAQGEVRGMLALVTAFIGWSYKAGVEEQFMAQQFGGDYARYKREVKKLIPAVY